MFLPTMTPLVKPSSLPSDRPCGLDAVDSVVILVKSEVDIDAMLVDVEAKEEFSSLTPLYASAQATCFTTAMCTTACLTIPSHIMQGGVRTFPHGLYVIHFGNILSSNNRV